MVWRGLTWFEDCVKTESWLLCIFWFFGCTLTTTMVWNYCSWFEDLFEIQSLDTLHFINFSFARTRENGLGMFALSWRFRLKLLCVQCALPWLCVQCALPMLLVVNLTTAATVAASCEAMWSALGDTTIVLIINNWMLPAVGSDWLLFCALGPLWGKG